MSSLRYAAQAALEALEAGLDVDPIFAGETIAALRAALAQEQAEPVEPVDADAAYQRWLADTHAPALRRMDSQGAFAAGWKAAAELRRLAAVEAQRDALLEMLKEITPSICHVSIVPEEKCAQCGRIARARAVIKAVEGEKT